jgi:hypothetical protein
MNVEMDALKKIYKILEITDLLIEKTNRIQMSVYYEI